MPCKITKNVVSFSWNRHFDVANTTSDLHFGFSKNETNSKILDYCIEIVFDVNVSEAYFIFFWNLLLEFHLFFCNFTFLCNSITLFAGFIIFFTYFCVKTRVFDLFLKKKEVSQTSKNSKFRDHAHGPHDKWIKIWGANASLSRFIKKCICAASISFLTWMSFHRDCKAARLPPSGLLQCGL